MLRKKRLFWIILSLGLIISPIRVDAAPTIISITPSTANNWGMVEITDLAGTGFDEETQVFLTREGQEDIPIFVKVESSSKISGEFELRGEEPGIWDVIVFNSNGESATQVGGFTLTVPPAPTITSNSPDIGDNVGIVTVQLTGNNFLEGAHVKLTRDGIPDVEAISVIVESSTSITCKFNLTGVEVGHWDIIVANPDGQTGISNSIDIVTGSADCGLIAGNTDFYVDENGSNNNDGLTPENAWKTITYALGRISDCIASPSGITIHVAAGTYNPDLGETFPLTMLDGVSLVGAGADVTTLDAQNTNRVIYLYRIGGGETISGFNITNGDLSSGRGGGIYSNSSSPTISDCTISNNTAGVGGGIYCESSSSPTINNCTITGNSSTARHGGGVFLSFYSNAVITNSTISNNTSAESAGGMWIIYSWPTISNCTISGNTSLSHGGGVQLAQYSGGLFTNCNITGNISPWGGGIGTYMASTSFINCTISGNKAVYGGGIDELAGHIYLYNCILYGNTASSRGPEIYVGVDWRTGGIPAIDLKYSLINPSLIYALRPLNLSNNINADPLFVNPRPSSEAPTSAGDYHLTDCSPPIDAGDPNSTPPDFPVEDIDGDSRPQDGNGDSITRYDMGADEYVGGGCPCTDNDFDDYAVEGNACGEIDCDDSDPSINPGATEVCDDVDNNCDGQVDEGLKNTYYRDLDGDTYGNPSDTTLACSVPVGYVVNNTDCDDSNAAINPTTVWYKDADADGFSDGSTLTQCARPANYYLSTELNATGGDCNDSNDTIYTGAPELCDGLDNNCDGVVPAEEVDTDADGLLNCEDTCTDTDGDGYGNPGYPVNTCAEDNCPDTANADQLDADGDGVGDACDTCTDTDNDGYGNPGYPVNTCAEDNCPDTANADQLDADGDGVGDACDTCTDTDNDGYGNPGYPVNTCTEDVCPDFYNPDQEIIDPNASISPSPAILWPPDHSVIPVTINVDQVTNNLGNTVFSITSVDITESSTQVSPQNYGENIYDPNNFEPDVEITGDLSLNLRSERTGATVGRTYTITVTATDCSGSYTFTTEVVVPHDQGQ